jgi:hypothetical protein
MAMNPTDFAETKLGRDLTAEFGWTVEDFKKMQWYWADAWTAAKNAGTEPASRGRAALKVKLALAKTFGATRDELVRIKTDDRADQNWQPGRLGRKWSLLFYAAQIMSKAPGLASGSVEDATKEI